jgi:hypothetical protein
MPVVCVACSGTEHILFREKAGVLSHSRDITQEHSVLWHSYI